jgi:SAM-dependent methyltransferase
VNWLINAGIQQVLSVLPAGEQLNYLFQKRVTRNLPVSDATLTEKIVLASRRLELFRQWNATPLANVSILEFGAGWDMIGPLTMCSLGVGKQTLIDITSHLRFELINNAIGRLPSALRSELGGAELRPLEQTAITSRDQLARAYSIAYDAPRDAAHTGFASDSFELISTNSTLEHIPPDALPAIMAESFRILKPGGVICHFVDMKDHYSYFDGSLSKYNFLRYAPARWKLVNPSLHYQNRLRLPEYRVLVRGAGFEILYEEIDHPTPEELASLRAMPLHSDFRRYEESDLAAQIYRVVARKA